jgi:hypothetical protein
VYIFRVRYRFATIIFTLHQIKDTKPEEKLIVGLLGGIGAILSNFIAALYIKMHAGSSENLKEFHHKLIETHKLLMSNFIASKIKTSELKETTYSEVAKSICNK